MFIVSPLCRESWIFYASENDGGAGREVQQSADDYLSRLAKSILAKDTSRPSGGQPRPAPTPTAPPPPSGRPPEPSRLSPLPPSARPGTSSSEIRRPETVATASGTREWVREVDYYDERGAFIPGTMIVLEDGTMGVFKETNAVKEYDIVYLLRENGRVNPQGIPLQNYEVTPVGRLTGPVFDQMIASGKWERDVIVFHLLKLKDRAHIPAHNPDAQSVPSQSSSGFSSETVSLAGFRRSSEDKAGEVPNDAKPPLTRGRKLTISFGGAQRWESVYWGKDELGHVVAHNTHDAWALMHLDLGRFKDTIQFGEIVGNDVLRKMESDFSKA